jgi:hypothetical protein
MTSVPKARDTAPPWVELSLAMENHGAGECVEEGSVSKTIWRENSQQNAKQNCSVI